MTRALSLAFGLLMVAAGTLQSDGPALLICAGALAAVVVGLVSRRAATLAVLATATALAFSGPSPVIAAVAGLAGLVYLVLRHARSGDAATSLTMPTVLGALGVTAAAVAGAAIPLALPWIPLVAPLAIVAIYLTVVSQYVH